MATMFLLAESVQLVTISPPLHPSNALPAQFQSTLNASNAPLPPTVWSVLSDLQALFATNAM
jgi:hypothetical protein